jgi:hypothetical protein
MSPAIGWSKGIAAKLSSQPISGISQEDTKVTLLKAIVALVLAVSALSSIRFNFGIDDPLPNCLVCPKPK